MVWFPKYRDFSVYTEVRGPQSIEAQLGQARRVVLSQQLLLTPNPDRLLSHDAPGGAAGSRKRQEGTVTQLWSHKDEFSEC